MEASNKTIRIFYQELSRLFYAMAVADGIIKEEELTELKNIVKEEWLPLEDEVDEYGTDLVYYILICFDWLMETDWDIKDVISRFHDYKRHHEHLFTDPVNQLILKTCYAIASAFAQRNKSEMMLFSQIEVILRQDQVK